MLSWLGVHYVFDLHGDTLLTDSFLVNATAVEWEAFRMSGFFRRSTELATSDGGQPRVQILEVLVGERRLRYTLPAWAPEVSRWRPQPIPQNVQVVRL